MADIIRDIIGFFYIPWWSGAPIERPVFEFLANFFAPVAVISIPLCLIVMIRRFFR